MKKLFPLLIIVTAVGGGLWLGSVVRDGPPSGPADGPATMRTISQHAQALNPPKAIDPFQLTTHHGKPFDLGTFKDKWSLVFFGYTHCPDICPTTMQVLADMTKQLSQTAPELHKNTQVVFVSVDPGRDSVEQLAKYVPFFDPAFVGVTGGLDQIAQFTRQLGIMHMQAKNKDGKGYLVDHSASILLFGPDARMHGIFSAPHQAQRLLKDYIKMRKLS